MNTANIINCRAWSPSCVPAADFRPPRLPPSSDEYTKIESYSPMQTIKARMCWNWNHHLKQCHVVQDDQASIIHGRDVRRAMRAKLSTARENTFRWHKGTVHSHLTNRGFSGPKSCVLRSCGGLETQFRTLAWMLSYACQKWQTGQ